MYKKSIKIFEVKKMKRPAVWNKPPDVFFVFILFICLQLK